MNEPSNFCNGNCNSGPTGSPYNDLPYSPGGSPLYVGTIDLDAKYYDGADHFNAHTYFGFLESKVTHDYLLTLSPLTFILSRSNFAGSGQVAAHWHGDNAATWEFLRYSVAQVMTYNIFGIPMNGADICGFAGVASESLCARWLQLGAFYPFARDHHTIDNNANQAPYGLGEMVLSTGQASLSLRYSLLKHYYSLFLEKKGRGTIFRPLFFEFPGDETLYDSRKLYSENEFMLGGGLLVTPCLYENHENVDAYLPKSTWYDFKSRAKIQDANDTPGPKKIQAPFSTSAPVFIRGGWVVPSQNTTSVLRTDDLDNTHELRVALATDSQGNFYSSGKILALNDMNDTNIVNKCIQASCLINVTVTGNAKQLSVVFSGDSQNTDEFGISGFQLYGISCESSSASLMLNGNHVDNVHFAADSSTTSTVITINTSVKVRPDDTFTINLRP